MTKMTEAEFQAIAGGSMLPLTAQTWQEIYANIGLLEDMIARVGKPRPRESEPALTFAADHRP